MSGDAITESFWKNPTLTNIAAEHALIGGILFDNAYFDRVHPWLKPEHFSQDFTKAIFEIITDRIPLGQFTDAVIIYEIFKQRGLLTEESDARRIAGFLDQAALGPEMVEYGRILVDLAIKRGLTGVADEIRKEVNGESASVELIEQFVGKLSDLMPSSQTGDWVDARIAVVDMVTRAMQGQTAAQMKYGIPALDNRTGGLFNGDLVVIAGRPSMGKTALANWIGMKAAESTPDAVVGVFNLEMSHEQSAMRLASLQYHLQTHEELPYTLFRKGEINTETARKVAAAMEQTAPLYWRSVPGGTYTQVRSLARELKRKRGRLDLLIIDYLQLMRAPGKRSQNRVEQITETTQEMKAMALELDVPVILLSQLSRQVEQRDNKRPFLSDLRDSGSIEQDADTIHFCFREHYYLSREQAPKDNKNGALDEHDAALIDSEPKFEILTPKLRMGAIGDDTVFWNAAHGVFFPTRAEAIGLSLNQGEFGV